MGLGHLKLTGIGSVGHGEAAFWNKHPLRESMPVAPACYHIIHKPLMLAACYRLLKEHWHFRRSTCFLPCIELYVINQLLLNVYRTIVTILSTAVTSLNVFVLM